MSSTCIAFTSDAAFKFRQLIPALEEHIKDNRGEILPHILIADYCRVVENSSDMEWVKQFLAYLEENFSGDNDQISNLIAVSFIEHLPLDSNSPIIHSLGCRMRKEYQRIFER